MQLFRNRPWPGLLEYVCLLQRYAATEEQTPTHLEAFTSEGGRLGCEMRGEGAGMPGLFSHVLKPSCGREVTEPVYLEVLTLW